jgi:hypothetical protein
MRADWEQNANSSIKGILRKVATGARSRRLNETGQAKSDKNGAGSGAASA